MDFRAIAGILGGAILAVVLAACGGDDGGGDTAPPTVSTSPAWGTAQVIQTGLVSSPTQMTGVSSPRIAFDASGNAIAVWLDCCSLLTGGLQTRRFSAASGTWGTAQSIPGSFTFGGGLGHQIAVDPGGNAIVVWAQYNGLNSDIGTSRFSAASGTWGPLQLIETSAGSVGVGTAGGSPQIAMDAGGNAIAVWRQHDGQRDSIYANRFNAASGAWGTAQLIETDNAGGALSPQIAMDAGGNAIAVWEQSDGTRNNIWANRFSAASGSWGTAQLIETEDAGSALSPQVAMDAGGNAIAIWQQSDGTRNNIWANRFGAATGTWGTARLIETDNAGTASAAQVAMDTGGNAIAVWQQSDGTRDNIWANRFSAASGTWGSAQVIETGTGTTVDPQIAMDASGNAIAVWRQFDATSDNVHANRFDAASGAWGTAQAIETSNQEAIGPQIAFDVNGNAMAIWSRSSSGIGVPGAIVVNRFD
jgi:hypothetical protein